ncbi:MAG: DUF3667 domain-containing protein [Rhizomicrobium sp.]
MEELEAILETGGAAAVEIAASALMERGGTVGHCANCGHPMIGTYCAVCGQPINTHRRTLGHLLHEVFKDIISFDSRILRTAHALVLQPGELPLAFREGRTQRYMPAVRLYLFVSLLFFLFLSVTGIAIMQFDVKVDTIRIVSDKAGDVFKIENGVRKQMEGIKADAKGNVYVDNEFAPRIPVPKIKADGSTINTVTNTARFFQRIGNGRTKLSPVAMAVLAQLRADASKEPAHSKSQWVAAEVADTMQKLQNDPAALNGPLMTWIPRILFLLLPLFALLLALFYRGLRKEFFFVDHLVFSLTMHTFAFVALIAAAGAAQIVSGGWVAGLLFSVLALYLLLSLKLFYGQNWTRTSLKFVAIGIIYPIFFLGPALLAAIVTSAVAA